MSRRAENLRRRWVAGARAGDFPAGSLPGAVVLHRSLNPDFEAAIGISRPLSSLCPAATRHSLQPA